MPTTRSKYMDDGDPDERRAMLNRRNQRARQRAYRELARRHHSEFEMLLEDERRADK